jgi:hypothetical protein
MPLMRMKGYKLTQLGLEAGLHVLKFTKDMCYFMTHSSQ